MMDMRSQLGRQQQPFQKNLKKKKNAFSLSRFPISTIIPYHSFPIFVHQTCRRRSIVTFALTEFIEALLYRNVKCEPSDFNYTSVCVCRKCLYQLAIPLLCESITIMQQRIFHCILIVIAFARLGSTSDYPLLPGWTAHVSGGRTYYYHQSTGRSTWERPSAWQQQPVPTQSVSQPQQQPQYQQQQYQKPYLQQQQSYIGQTGVPQPFNNDQQQQLYTQQQPVRSQPQQQSQSPSGVVESTVFHSNNHNNNITSLSKQSNNTPIPGSNTNHVQTQTQTQTMQPKNESSTSVETSRTSTQPKPQVDEHQLLANELSMVTELRKADQQIDELNDYIDTLLEKIKVGEEERTALAAATAAAAAAVVTNSSNVSNDREADLEVMNELSEKIDFLQTELVEKNEEMVRLQTSKDILEKKLIDTSSALKILQGNFTTQQQEIKQFKKRGKEQEKELEDCYREIGLLETDLKACGILSWLLSSCCNGYSPSLTLSPIITHVYLFIQNVAGSSMKRLTQRQSIFSRLWDGISSHNPLQFFGLSSSSSSSHATTSGK